MANIGARPLSNAALLVAIFVITDCPSAWGAVPGLLFSRDTVYGYASGGTPTRLSLHNTTASEIAVDSILLFPKGFDLLMGYKECYPRYMSWGYMVLAVGDSSEAYLGNAYDHSSDLVIASEDSLVMTDFGVDEGFDQLRKQYAPALGAAEFTVTALFFVDEATDTVVFHVDHLPTAVRKPTHRVPRLVPPVQVEQRRLHELSGRVGASSLWGGAVRLQVTSKRKCSVMR